MTTEGTNSVSIDDCCLPLPIPDEENTLSIILAVFASCNVLGILAGVIVLYCRQKGTYKMSNVLDSGYTTDDGCYNISKPIIDPTAIASIEGFDFDTITLGVNSPCSVSSSSNNTGAR